MQRQGIGNILYLCHFTKSPALLAEVDYDAAATILCFLDRLLDAEDEVGPACTNIRTEDIAAIALPWASVSGNPSIVAHFVCTYLVMDA